MLIHLKKHERRGNENAQKYRTFLEEKAVELEKDSARQRDKAEKEEHQERDTLSKMADQILELIHQLQTQLVTNK